MTIGEVYTHLLNELKAKYAYEEARAMVFGLLEHHLQITKARIMVQFNIEVPDITLPPLALALDDLLADKPLQYVIGKAWFMNQEYLVNEHVLIPRPETEELVQIVITAVDSLLNEHPYPLKILDIGTGSGCIAIALKSHYPEISLYALDNSDAALAVARENAQNHRAEVYFYQADILREETLEGLPPMDILVSNPPYVLEKEKSAMKPNVLNHEPPDALYVPDVEPLLYYKAIAAYAAENIRPGGLIFLEINEMFGDEVKSLFLSHKFKDVRVEKDLSGKDRFLLCHSN